MRKELQEALTWEFPFIRWEEDGDVRERYDGEGLDMGNGWFQLVHDMCAEITAAYEAEGRPVDIVVE
ncbi:hypothetical protein [Oscillibacter sp. CU971]|uniref:hypothetical protein n=1 Tax=Oscillibacter sp. CU971 TaxID=2780102 RepID=UPI00195D3851|nr:hypothetical protein [Oscillibacter sp. CU971]